uniref:NDR1 n=1 Tax=Solanum tuberosum TaxID=4113 RepID=M1CEM5_SOLTU
MKDKGVRYDKIILSFYYGTNTSIPLGNSTINGFYQGHDKKAKKKGKLEIQKMAWDAALKNVTNTSKVVFRVDVATRVSYKIIFWFGKKHNFTVENKTLEVDSTGGIHGHHPQTVRGPTVHPIGPWFVSANSPRTQLEIRPSVDPRPDLRSVGQVTNRGLCLWIDALKAQLQSQLTVDQHGPSFDARFTLSYTLSAFQVLMHTCATSSRDVGSGSQHPGHA